MFNLETERMKAESLTYDYLYRYRFGAKGKIPLFKLPGLCPTIIKIVAGLCQRPVTEKQQTKVPRYT